MLQSGDHEVVFDDDFARSRVVPDKETGRIKDKKDFQALPFFACRKRRRPDGRWVSLVGP